MPQRGSMTVPAKPGLGLVFTKAIDAGFNR